MHGSFLSSLSLAALGGVVLALCSCDSMAPQQRRVAFDEATFAPSAAPGSGAVTGRASGLFYGTDQVYYKDTIRTAHHLTVQLMPDNAYTEEIEQRTLLRRHPLVPQDPRFEKYVRAVTTDGDGNFTFSHVPPGRYYITCRFTWPDTGPSYDADDAWPTLFNTTAEQTLFGKVTVAPGQTVRVAHWDTSAWFALPVPTS